jgi:hypothetical protein
MFDVVRQVFLAVDRDLGWQKNFLTPAHTNDIIAIMGDVG